MLKNKNYNNIYQIWLIDAVIWNFAVPGATPIEDVLVAVLLLFLGIRLKKNSKIIFYSSEKNIS